MVRLGLEPQYPNLMLFPLYHIVGFFFNHHTPHQLIGEVLKSPKTTMIKIAIC